MVSFVGTLFAFWLLAFLTKRVFRFKGIWIMSMLLWLICLVWDVLWYYMHIPRMFSESLSAETVLGPPLLALLAAAAIRWLWVRIMAHGAKEVGHVSEHGDAC